MSRKARIPLTLALNPNLNADAYLQWAYQTSFLYFDGVNSTIVVLVEFSQPIQLRSRHWRRTLKSNKLQINGWYDGYHYAAVSVSAAALPQQLQALQSLGATCFELGAPSGLVTVSFNNLPTSAAPGPETVIGIIDDGCPFAHRDFRGAQFGQPAVRFVWDQGMTVPSLGGTPLTYGVAFMEAALQAFVQKATAANGVTVDEDAAYRLSGLPSLRGATSHGAQVMSHATGRAPGAIPVQMLQRTDIAFVQLPSDALDDPSGNWLDQYALDGIHAIRTYAESCFSTAASRVVINLSYGRQTGPHDGTSFLEKAIDEITTTAAAANYFLKVVVPSGNSHRLRTHAEFTLNLGGGTIDWCVSPDSQLPSYLEIWLPKNTPMAPLDISLQCPTGETIQAHYPGREDSVDGTASVYALPVCGNLSQTVIVMVVASTARSPDSSLPATTLGAPLAVAGRWKVKVAVTPGLVAGVAHAYLACKDPNMGRARLGRSGYLDSPGYDPKRYLRESDQLAPNPPQGSAEVVARGSMSGIATGTGVGVVAGYVLSTQTPSLYSSGGPTRGPRVGPDWAYPADDSVVRQGLRAGGNRSATVMRLIGTSFAAPQYVRELVVTPAPTGNPPVLGAAAAAPNPPPWFPFRVGGGMRP